MKAGALRGEAAEVRDRGAAADPEGSQGAGRLYWPEVARLMRACAKLGTPVERAGEQRVVVGA